MAFYLITQFKIYTLIKRFNSFLLKLIMNKLHWTKKIVLFRSILLCIEYKVLVFRWKYIQQEKSLQYLQYLTLSLILRQTSNFAFEDAKKPSTKFQRMQLLKIEIWHTFKMCHTNGTMSRTQNKKKIHIFLRLWISWKWITIYQRIEKKTPVLIKIKKIFIINILPININLNLSHR